MIPGTKHRGLSRLYFATLNSWRGVCFAAKSESAFRQELIAFVIAVPAAFLLAPSVGWFAALVGVLMVLLAVELLNTAVEKLADHVMPNLHPDIKIVKDVGSGAVLCALVLVGSVWATAAAVRFGWL